MANRAQASRPRMRKEWQSIPGVFQSQTANGTIIGSSLAFTNPTTVLRCLTEYLFGPTGVATAGDGCSITCGLCVVSTDAATLGASAVPDPAGEMDYPWLYWASHMFEFPSATSSTAGQGDQSGMGTVRRVVDVKSMRKITPRQSLVWVFEYVDNAGIPPMTVDIGITRVLVGLH